MRLTEEQVKVVEENESLIGWYMNKHNLSEEFYGLLAESLIKAVKGHDISKGALSTYFYTIARRDVGAEFHKNKVIRQNECVYEDYMLERLDDGYTEVIYNEDFTENFSERQVNIVNMIRDGYLNYKIAEELGVSPATITREILLMREIIEKRR